MPIPNLKMTSARRKPTLAEQSGDLLTEADLPSQALTSPAQLGRDNGNRVVDCVTLDGDGLASHAIAYYAGAQQ